MKEDRRCFLGTAAGACLGLGAGVFASPPLRAEAQEASWAEPVIGGPQRQYAADAVGPTGLKLTGVETFTRGPIGLVRIQADSGLDGWGQVAPYDVDLTAQVLHRKLARHFLGRDPAELDLIVDRCIEANYKYPWSFVCRALAGLDTAVWDLLGRFKGRSVTELLGARPRPLPVYGSSMSRTITPEEEAQRLIRLRDELGFRAFKVRVGRENGRDQDQWPGRTESLVPLLRRRLGDGIDLLADGNSRYTPPKAIEVGRLLEGSGYVHFEEPCPYWELEWTAMVAAELSIPVAGGEQDNDLAQWRRMIRMGAVDIVQPDLCYVGGLTRSLRVAAMAERAGLKVVPHSANLSMVTLCTLHLFASIRNAGRHVEYSIEDDAWARGLYEPALQVTDGMVRMPEGPGWGVTPSREWLEAAERKETRL